MLGQLAGLLQSFNRSEPVGFCDLLTVHLHTLGYPTAISLTLPGSISPTQDGTHWSVIRVPIEQVMKWLARWSPPSFPDRAKLMQVLRTVEHGGLLRAPVVLQWLNRYDFQSGAHTALMLAELGAHTLPLVAPASMRASLSAKWEVLDERLLTAKA
ncbi:MAG TPA: hypothetical protein VFB54_16820 [Burkholderiales bacterium]|nr:hypothetical protein [Burkholderiales bacterium]